MKTISLIIAILALALAACSKSDQQEASVLEKASDAVAETTESIKEGTTSLVDQAAEKAGEVAGEVKEGLNQAVDGVKETASNTYSDVKEAAASSLSDAKEAMSTDSTTNTGSEELSAMEKAEESLEDAKKAGQATVDEIPDPTTNIKGA